MLKIGLIREGKIPTDNRVALTPSQCKWVHKNLPDLHVIVQSSPDRCYSDKEYSVNGIRVQEDVSECDILMGIKEVPIDMIIPGKTYILFSHTKKLQPQNQKLIKAFISNKNTLVDYECLLHEDKTRVLGFGFFAGIVGAHNGMMAYGKRTGAFHLDKVNSQKTFRKLIHCYFGMKLPNIKIAVTGNGRVAHGVLEIMNLMGIRETEPDLFLEKQFTYPVYVHLKPSDIYKNKISNKYNREEFHTMPEKYVSCFEPMLSQTDILMNGVYWEKHMPRLFEMDELSDPKFRIATIADITDDYNGSVPCNFGDASVNEPVYGVNKKDYSITEPYLETSVDVMAVSNLPNELPRDASRYFGEQLIKYVLEELGVEGSVLIRNATILKDGELMGGFEYMRGYATETRSDAEDEERR